MNFGLLDIQEHHYFMKSNKILQYLLPAIISLSGCRSIIESQGAALGNTGGGIAGSVIGRASGNEDIGTVIGATLGEATATVLVNKLDQQAEEIRKNVQGVKVAKTGDNIRVEFNIKSLFKDNSSKLSLTAKQNLDELAKIIQKYPDTSLDISVHTDNTGSGRNNQMLSDKRAASVAAYMAEEGIGKGRITTKGFGETSPRYSNDSETGRLENRRVEFLITGRSSSK